METAGSSEGRVLLGRSLLAGATSQAMSAPSFAWRRTAEAVAVAVPVALLLRWPVGLYPDALPHDPNTALHAVAAADLWATADPFHLHSLDWPTGVPVRFIGWPLLSVAALLQGLLSPVAAWNVALTLVLIAQAVGFAELLHRCGAPRSGRLAGAVAALASPLVLLFLGNGQPENVVFLPILISGVAAWRGARVATAAGLLLAAFSSPYQGLVAGLFALAGGLVGGRRRLLWAVLVGGLCVVPVGLYFASQAVDAPGADLTRTRPADADHPQPATLQALVTPALGLDGDLAVPGWDDPDRRWPQRHPRHAPYAGFALLVLGVAGLWQGRRQPLVQLSAGAGLACLVFSLGARAGPVLLPWAAVAGLPGVGRLGATLRFVTGVEVALAVGVCTLLSHRRGALTVGAALILLADGLVASPGVWPVPASSLRGGPLADALPPGPTLVWPGTPLLSTHQHALLRLALDRPIATFNGPPPADTAVAPGTRPPVPTKNPQGETVSRWTARLVGEGARGLVEVTPLPTDQKQPVTSTAGTAVGELRVYWLSTR